MAAEYNWLERFSPRGVAAVGVLVLVYGGWQGSKGNAAAHWPTTTGKILEASLYQSNTWNDHFGTEGTYIPKLRYSYKVDGVTYEGHNQTLSAGVFTFFFDKVSRAEAHAVIDPYNTGDVVTVYYDPADPAMAVLRPGASTESKWSVVTGVFLFCVAGWRWTRGK